MRAARVWTAKELRTADAMRREGATLTSIGHVLGRSQLSVGASLRYHGCKRSYVRWDRRHDRELRKLLAQGWSLPELATHFGRAINTISFHRNRLGIKSDARHGQRYRRRMRQSLRNWLHENGYEDMGSWRQELSLQAAEKMGWPHAENKRQALILQVLFERGPLTRLDIVKAIRPVVKPVPKSDCTYKQLSRLRGLELVVRVGFAWKRQGKHGRIPDLYDLSTNMRLWKQESVNGC